MAIQSSDRLPASQNEASIRALLDTYVQAVHQKDFAALKTCYAPGLLAYDLLPPLQYQGFQEYGKLWEICFSCFDGPIFFEQKDVRIHADQEIAFSYSLTKMGGNMKNENGFEPGYMWFRSTICYQKINGNWAITHEHTSVPADVESGKACMELKPV